MSVAVHARNLTVFLAIFAPVVGGGLYLTRRFILSTRKLPGLRTASVVPDDFVLLVKWLRLDRESGGAVSVQETKAFLITAAG